MPEKIVGILGGMGPEATVDLMARVIAATPAADDSDHIHMIVDNNTKVPSRITALIERSGSSPGPELADMAKKLVTHGADILVMPCNTAHHYYNEIAGAVDVPVINLIELVAETVMSSQPLTKSVGILASTAVQLTGLYDQVFDRQAVEVRFPSDLTQGKIMELIKRVKSSDVSARDIENLNSAVSELEQSGVNGIIVACTELSVIADDLKTTLPMFDASQLLADEVVRQVKGII
ncbi:MAG: aspartate racemase [Arenicella sp.]|jgi:aspartate racemase